jgi:hypothetical protein
MCTPCSIPRDALSATNGFDHPVTGDRRTIRQAQDALATQMPSALQCGRQALGHRQLT